MSCFGNFLFGKREVKLPDEVIVDVHLLLSVRLFAYGFVNNDFINQLTRHLFCQLCGLLILLDELDKPSDMSRGRFGLLQLLLNFRYLALKAVLFSRVFLHQGLVLLFGQQTNEILIKASNQTVKLIQSAVDCLKFILLLLWLTIRLCFPFAFQFFRKATLICDNVA